MTSEMNVVMILTGLSCAGTYTGSISSTADYSPAGDEDNGGESCFFPGTGCSGGADGKPLGSKNCLCKVLRGLLRGSGRTVYTGKWLENMCCQTRTLSNLQVCCCDMTVKPLLISPHDFGSVFDGHPSIFLQVGD